MRMLILLVFLVGCGPPTEPQPDPPKEYNQSVVTTKQNGEITYVEIVFPGTINNVVVAENRQDIDALIESTEIIVADLKMVQEQMPAAEWEEQREPPEVVNPESSASEEDQ